MPHLSTEELIGKLTSWVNAGTSFYHTRWGDAEYLAMFQLIAESRRAGNGCQFKRTLCRELKSTALEVLDRAITDQSIIIGSVHFEQPLELPYCKKISDTLDKFGKGVNDICWAPGNFWYDRQAELLLQVTDKGLFALVEALQKTPRQKVLVSNRYSARASKCLESESIVLPICDSWDRKDEILKACSAFPQATFIWCAGMTGKVLSWKLYKDFPETNHLDCGHLFDAVFGVDIRRWTKDPDRMVPGSHQWFLRSKLAPYILNMIDS